MVGVGNGLRSLGHRIKQAQSRRKRRRRNPTGSSDRRCLRSRSWTRSNATGSSWTVRREATTISRWAANQRSFPFCRLSQQRRANSEYIILIWHTVYDVAGVGNLSWQGITKYTQLIIYIKKKKWIMCQPEGPVNIKRCCASMWTTQFSCHSSTIGKFQPWHH